LQLKFVVGGQAGGAFGIKTLDRLYLHRMFAVIWPEWALRRIRHSVTADLPPECLTNHEIVLHWRTFGLRVVTSSQ